MDKGLDKPALLSRHEFFRDMPAPAIARLAAHARTLVVPSGERIFSKGDDGFGLLAVVSGLVRISVPSDGATELTLNLIGANEVFGEIALLDGLPRTTDATAMTDCRLLLLERRDFLSTLMGEPSAALTLLQILSRRLRRTSEQLEQASFGQTPRRLAQALLALAKRSGDPEGVAGVIDMSQRAMGNMVGLSRESTNRYLRAWHREGLIALKPGGLAIVDAPAMAALAAGDVPAPNRGRPANGRPRP